MYRSYSSLQNLLPHYRIVHRLPGRVRIHIPHLAAVPSNWRSYVEPVAEVIEIKMGIKKVNIQPISGRLLITYDPDMIQENDIVKWLALLVKIFLNLLRTSDRFSEKEFIPLLNRMRIQLLSYTN
jgi:hypothetical protein